MFFSHFCIKSLPNLSKTLSFLISALLHSLPTAFLAGKLHSGHGLPLPETENALKTAFHPSFPADFDATGPHQYATFSTQDVNTRLHHFVDKFLARMDRACARRVDNHAPSACAQHLFDMKRYFQYPANVVPRYQAAIHKLVPSR